MLVTLADVHNESWTRSEHLLANVCDLLGVAGHNALVGPHVNPKGLRNVRPPKPLQRPGMAVRRRTTLADLQAHLAGRGGADG